MEFQPPDPAQLANVQSLNLEFLALVQSVEGRSLVPGPLPFELADALRALDSSARSRLARSPFLLFSLAEHDASRWRRLFDDRLEADLIDALQRPGIRELRLVSAALGFLWHQSIQSPYVARVVSGAPLDWCERLAGSTLVGVLARATDEAGLLELRCGTDESLWRKLLVAGTSRERTVRRAARFSALQTLLTAGDAVRVLPAAACSMPGTPQRVADKAGVSRQRMRGYNTPPHASAVDKRSLKDLRKR